MTKSSPARQAINEHLHRRHGGIALSGDTLSRYVQHDLLHAECDGGVTGDPLHTHANDDDNTIENLRPLFLNEDAE